MNIKCACCGFIERINTRGKSLNGRIVHILTHKLQFLIHKYSPSEQKCVLADARSDVITARLLGGVFVSVAGLFVSQQITLIYSLISCPVCVQRAWDPTELCAGCCLPPPLFPPTAAQSVPVATMAFVPAPSPTVVDQTTLMKKYLQFVAALTDANTRKFIDLRVYCWTWVMSDVWQPQNDAVSENNYVFNLLYYHYAIFACFMHMFGLVSFFRAVLISVNVTNPVCVSIKLNQLFNIWQLLRVVKRCLYNKLM